MGYFQVRYDSRVVIYKHKMFIRLVTDGKIVLTIYHNENMSSTIKSSEILIITETLKKSTIF